MRKRTEQYRQLMEVSKKNVMQEKTEYLQKCFFI